MIQLDKNTIIEPNKILSVYEINKKCHVRYYHSPMPTVHEYKLFSCDCSFSSLINYIKNNRGKLQLAWINRKYYVNPKYVFEVEKKVHGSVLVYYGKKRRPYWIAKAEKSYEYTLAKLKRAWRCET